MDNNNGNKVATEMNEEEMWTSCQCDGVDYPLYRVSSKGRVLRVEYSVTYTKGDHLVSATMQQRLVQPKNNGNGYLQVVLRDADDNKHYVMLSRLVLGSFEPVYNPELTDVDHINSDRTDNRLANLRRLSHADNLRQEHRMSLIRKPVRVISSDHTVQWLFNSVTEAAEWLGVQQGYLSGVLSRGTSIHGYSVYFK